MEDELIIDLFFKRSEEAISETDKKYGKYCAYIANNILKNKEDTDECVTDTYLNAWNTIPPQRPSIFKAFLGKITRNLALNIYKRNHTRKRYNGIEIAIDELEECIPDNFNIEQLVEKNELSKILNEFLYTLEKEKRTIFIERYWYITPVKEIANKYHISESKAKMTLLRSRQELKDFLKKRGVVS